MGGYQSNITFHPEGPFWYLIFPTSVHVVANSYLERFELNLDDRFYPNFSLN